MTQNDYDSIRKRAEKRIRERQKFFRDLVSFMLINSALWVFYLLASGGDGGFPWPLWVTGFWGLSLVGDAIKVLYTNSPDREARRALAVEREMEREMDALGLSREEVLAKRKNDEKPRNALEMRLGDDGELVPVEDPEEIQSAKPKRLGS